MRWIFALAQLALVGASRFAVMLAADGGEPADAERAWRESIDDGNDDGWLQLGHLLAMQPGRQADAERAYRAAIAAGDSTAWCHLGELLHAQPGRASEAEEALRTALEHAANPAIAQPASAYLGWLLVRGGDRARAQMAFEAAIRAGLRASGSASRRRIGLGSRAATKLAGRASMATTQRFVAGLCGLRCSLAEPGSA